MRILADNYVDAATISASPAMLTTLPETNLQNAYREQVARWENVDGQAITVTWSGAKPVSCVCLYRCNFSGTATWRVRVYEDASLATVTYDSGSVTCCHPVPLGSLEWGVDPLGKHLYSDWDYSVASIWFTPVLGGAVVIDVVDVENTDGYVQASRLFIGAYFEPSCVDADGVESGWQENSRPVRTEGGSLRVESGAAWRTMRLDLKWMIESDRRRFVEILRGNGLRNDVFVSVFPGRADALERDYQMQARLTSLSPLTVRPGLYADGQLNLEEI